jgi:hypothetical protein
VAAYLAYFYAEESKGVWAKTDDIYEKLLESTTKIVKDFKQMQMVIKGYSIIHGLGGPDYGPLYVYGKWLITTCPDNFKDNDTDYNDLAKQIRNPKYTNSNGQSYNEPEIKVALENVLDATFLQLYSEINDSRTTLGVISFYSDEMNTIINILLQNFRDIKNSIKNDPRFYITQGRNNINDGISNLQLLCKCELEYTRTGKRGRICQNYCGDPEEPVTKDAKTIANTTKVNIPKRDEKTPDEKC